MIATMRSLDEMHGAVRVEEVYDTDIDDLWEACTEPERLSRWIAEVSGDLRPGGEFVARFTSGWEGTGRIDVCEPGRRLLVSTMQRGHADEQVIEVTLISDGNRTVLVIEERGLPADQLPAYGAGWQVHVEDLVAHVNGRERCDITTRWAELIPVYQQTAVR